MAIDSVAERALREHFGYAAKAVLLRLCARRMSDSIRILVGYDLSCVKHAVDAVMARRIREFLQMQLHRFVNTFGQDLMRRYGERVHKLAIHAGFTCPNRDGTKGRGGCTFCNNVSFSPNAREAPRVAEQIAAGRRTLAKRTGARLFIAYFQAYTNTYADLSRLRALYDEALAEPDVIGLSIGTRPDCVPEPVLELLAAYRARGREVWLELGLQSASDETLERVNRGHGFPEYRSAVQAARAYGIPVCTHLIVGLPGEGRREAVESLEKVLSLGVDGLKLHPLHVVRRTSLANEWRRGGYEPLSESEYASIAADLIERTPTGVVFHRVTGTASREILLSPSWCEKKWRVLNAIARELAVRRTCQGSAFHRSVRVTRLPSSREQAVR